MSALAFREVVKHYADADEVVQAVDGVNIEIQPGEMLALYGPSGSGKTTLLLLAAGLIAPDRGTVCFHDANLASLSSRELADYQRRDVGFIYQSFHLMSGVPAVENAAVKLLADGVSLGQARGMATEWLERVGLGHRLNHVPERLSGGERQRVAIARALVNKPRLILADEPTGSLDSRRGQEVLRLLAEIAREQQAAVLLVTHDPQAAAVADRVCGLRDGKLVEDERDGSGERSAPVARLVSGM
ncbi:MAG TPA: ABC transporter ATP-binding protein [Solirubrobacteraceae bacterium]|nr:ABC transporter ATP-binding protein [Solirubrobacteraceae bacterium]